MYFPDGLLSPANPASALQGDVVTFVPAVPVNPNLQYSVQVDNAAAAACPNNQCQVNTTSLVAGAHNVTVTVKDTTPKVRNTDDLKLLQGSVTWSLTVNACEEEQSTTTYQVPYDQFVSQTVDGQQIQVPQYGLDIHTVTTETDCHGNVSSTDNVTSSTCYNCSYIETSITGDPFLVEDDGCALGFDSCTNTVNEYDYSCPDGLASTAETVVQACACSTIYFGRLGPPPANASRTPGMLIASSRWPIERRRVMACRAPTGTTVPSMVGK
jgi:hypothetical protein